MKTHERRLMGKQSKFDHFPLYKSTFPSVRATEGNSSAFVQRSTSDVLRRRSLSLSVLLTGRSLFYKVFNFIRY